MQVNEIDPSGQLVTLSTFTLPRPPPPSSPPTPPTAATTPRVPVSAVSAAKNAAGVDQSQGSDGGQRRQALPIGGTQATSYLADGTGTLSAEENRKLKQPTTIGTPATAATGSTTAAMEQDEAIKERKSSTATKTETKVEHDGGSGGNAVLSTTMTASWAERLRDRVGAETVARLADLDAAARGLQPDRYATISE